MNARITRDDVQGSLRLSGQVVRYHTWPTIQRQSVAEHCWQVWRIYHSIFGMPDEETTRYIIYHDSAELQTGDVPFLFKKNLPQVARDAIKMAEENAEAVLGIQVFQLGDGEKTRVKVCDILEMTEFAMHEMTLGNRYAEPVYDRTILEAREYAGGLDSADQERVDNYMIGMNL